MRIIGGKHGSRQLKMANPDITKSTSDKVKESVFNMIQVNSDWVCLDLFSGAGSYGLEAISRGANFVYFNDINNTAYRTTKENIKALKEQDKTKVDRLDYKKAIKKYEKDNILFDLIFLDPPYKEKGYEDLLKQIKPILKKDGLVVLEFDKWALFENDEDLFKVLKDRIYGRKRIVILINN